MKKAFVGAEVPPSMKARLQKLAKKKHTNVSTLLRQVIADLLGGER